ncbi:MAG: ABC transporter substrate-binding protein [Coriobacteriales bacterium]
MPLLLCALALAALLAGFATGCSAGGAQGEGAGHDWDVSPSLVLVEVEEPEYATGFAIGSYEGGYELIDIVGEGRFLVVPEGAAVPDDLAEDVVVLRRPLDRIYLVASATMDMFRSLDAIDAIRLSGTKQGDWHIAEAADAMASGAIVYAGKYNMPDYERILAEECDLAVESTMIYHNPEVKEALEGYGIPVLVDQSSYENEPLGRIEWVKVYGALLGKKSEADAVFEEQRALFDAVVADSQDMAERKSVAFFYITANGSVNVRKADDYVPKMIELAGGSYALTERGDPDSASSTVGMQMEEFYAAAKDADYILYNSTIAGEVESLDELLDKSEFLGRFKAVSDGNVWCVTQNMYQDSMELGAFISDVHKILVDPATPDDQLTYMKRLT